MAEDTQLASAANSQKKILASNNIIYSAQKQRIRIEFAHFAGIFAGIISHVKSCTEIQLLGPTSCKIMH